MRLVNALFAGVRRLEYFVACVLMWGRSHLSAQILSGAVIAAWIMFTMRQGAVDWKLGLSSFLCFVVAHYVGYLLWEFHPRVNRGRFDGESGAEATFALAIVCSAVVAHLVTGRISEATVMVIAGGFFVAWMRYRLWDARWNDFDEFSFEGLHTIASYGAPKS